jgi:DNA-binding YbaB/EbfC family protein
MGKGKGGFGGGMPGNMQAMMKQAQQMQKNVLKAQEDAKKLVSEGSAGGGVVKATASGTNTILTLEISPDAVDPEDVEMLQDLIIAACNDALTAVQAQVDAEISKVTGGLNIPGL